MKSNGLVKLIAILLLAVLGLWLIYSLIFGTGMGYGFNFTGNYRGGYANMGITFGYGSTLAYLLLLLIKILFGVFIVALAAGSIIWIKNNLFSKEEIETIKNTFTVNKTQTIKPNCSICARPMEAEWKVCPHCGKEKELINE